MNSKTATFLMLLALSQSSRGWIAPQRVSHFSNARVFQRSSSCLCAKSDEVDSYDMHKRLFGVLGRGCATLSVTAALIFGGPVAHASEEYMSPQVSNDQGCKIVELSQRDEEISEDAETGAIVDEGGPSANGHQDGQALVASEDRSDEDEISPQSEEEKAGDPILAKAPETTETEEHNTFDTSSEVEADEETLVATSEASNNDEEPIMQLATDTDGSVEANSEETSAENTELLASSSKEENPQLTDQSTESQDTVSEDSNTEEEESTHDSSLVASYAPSTAEEEAGISEAPAASNEETLAETNSKEEETDTAA